MKKAKKLIVLESRRVVNLHVGSSRWATIKTLFRQFLCSLVICKALVNKLSEGVCLFAVNRLLLVFMVAKQFHSSLRNKTKRRLRGAKSHNLRFHRNNVLTKICPRRRCYFWPWIILPKWTWSWSNTGLFWGCAVWMILASDGLDRSIFIPWLLSALKTALYSKCLSVPDRP